MTGEQPERTSGGGSSRRVALITGVSRERGIGTAIGRRLAPSHDLLLTGLPSYDAAQPWGTEGDEVRTVVTDLEARGATVEYLVADLTDPGAPGALVDAAMERFGRLDSLVANHAHSIGTPLGRLDAEEIDRHLIVNVRATLLLVEAFAEAHTENTAQGKIVLLSSGQRLGPMPGELAYAASKGGVEGLVATLADTLARDGIMINAVNPGPTDTGYLTGSDYEAVRARFPSGRWGTPEDAAHLVGWLLSDEADWLTGQVIDSEGGFRR